ncbi:MAG: FeoB-associated Cys-rich membrane protein [Solirubrobacterales bacterium]
MFIEITVTIIILSLAVFILYKNIKKKASGECDCDSCGNCSSHCPNYKK